MSKQRGLRITISKNVAYAQLGCALCDLVEDWLEMSGDPEVLRCVFSSWLREHLELSDTVLEIREREKR